MRVSGGGGGVTLSTDIVAALNAAAAPSAANPFATETDASGIVYTPPTTSTFPNLVTTGGGTPVQHDWSGSQDPKWNGLHMSNIGNGAGALRSQYLFSNLFASATPFDKRWGVRLTDVRSNPSLSGTGFASGFGVALRANTGVVFRPQLRTYIDNVTYGLYSWATIGASPGTVSDWRYGQVAAGAGDILREFGQPAVQGFRIVSDGTNVSFYSTAGEVTSNNGWLLLNTLALATIFPGLATLQYGVVQDSTCDVGIPTGGLCYHYA